MGVAVYKMLTNRLPFRRNSAGALLIAHLRQPPPDPRDFVPELPAGVARAILRALAKDPKQRFDTAGEFAAALGLRS
jgi:serine/threonine-protein kinase